MYIKHEKISDQNAVFYAWLELKKIKKVDDDVVSLWLDGSYKKSLEIEDNSIRTYPFLRMLQKYTKSQIYDLATQLMSVSYPKSETKSNMALDVALFLQHDSCKFIEIKNLDELNLFFECKSKKSKITTKLKKYLKYDIGTANIPKFLLSKYILDYAVNLLCTQKNIKEFSIFEIEDIPPLIFEKIDIIEQSDNGE
jgi:hypothetical protein